MRLHIIPLLLIVVPIAEISVFVIIGGEIGVLPTIALIVLTAILGSILLRWQGLSTLSKIQSEMEAGRVPGRELTHGAMILVAGILLLVPGFVTDIFGILLFIPPVREIVWRFLRSRVSFVATRGPFRQHRPGDPFHGSDNENDGRTGNKNNRGPGSVVDLDESEFSRARPGKGSGQSPWSDGKKALPENDKPDSKKQDGL